MTDIGVGREPPRLPGLDAEFEVVRELGRGGSAIVYLALERELGRQVAIKVIHPALAVDEEVVQRLVREARTLARLHHPNIITLYGTRRLADGRLALIMQYAGAETLRARLRSVGPLTFASATGVLRDIAGALAHAHRQRVVHRDIKPENIHLDPVSGRAHLSDFGIARIWDHDSHLTLGGIAIGTPTYMSPEQIDGAELDGRSDLYSLGLVGWELLAGSSPWAGENLYSIIYKQKHEALPSLAKLRPGIPETLRTALEVALAKDPADRWPDAEAFLHQLNGGPTPGELGRRDLAGATRRGIPAGSGPGAVRSLESGGDTAELPTVRFRRDATGAEMTGAGASGVGGAGGAESSRAGSSGAGSFVAVGSGPAGEVGTGVARMADAIARRRGSRWRSRLVALAVATLGISLGAAGLAIRRGPGTLEGLGGAIFTESKERSAVAPTSAGASDDTAPRTTELLPRVPELPPTGEYPPLATREVAALPGNGTAPREMAASRDVAIQDTAIRRSDGTGGEPSSRAAPGTDAPVEAVSGPPVLVARPEVATGGAHTCSLSGSGQLSCWGANDRGQTGTSGRWVLAPASVAMPTTLVTISAGAFHTCALNSVGNALCWGANERGQLGTGLRTTWSGPTIVAGDASFTRITAGLAHTCALTYQGMAYCWGANDNGQLGDGTRSDRAVPTVLAGPQNFRVLFAGWSHTCGITHDDVAYCWGENRYGQLGDDTSTDRQLAVAVAGALQVRTLALGSAHTCGLAADGMAYCWGRNDAGQLGTGDLLERPTPTPITLDQPLVQVSAGGVHTCGLTTEGRAFCWGKNLYGQLGDGTTTDRSYPTPVAGGLYFSTIQANGAHTCGRTRAGSTYCWGYNADGQLGDGTRTNQARPVAVQPARY